MKRIIFLVFGLICTGSAFAEKIVYSNENGKNITVEAEFIGWAQSKVTFEGRFEDACIAFYEAYCSIDSEKWGEYELISREPEPYGSLLALKNYKNLLEIEINRYSNYGSLVTTKHGNILKLFSIPVGQSSSIWWSKDGKSFFMFFKLYLLK